MMRLCDQHQIVYDFGYNRAQSVRCPVCLAEREIDQHERENERLRENEQSRTLTIMHRVWQLETAMQSAMKELGVPQPDYPAPVTNAYELLKMNLETQPPSTTPLLEIP